MRSILVLGFCLLGALTAAQRPMHPINELEMPTAGLLLTPEVQKEIALSPSQQRQVNAILANVRAESNRLLSPGPSKSGKPNKPDFLGVAKVMEAATMKINSILTPGQRQRLDQIGLQQAGPLGVLRADITAKLKLTTAQQNAISKAVLQTVRSGHGGSDPEKMGREMELQKAAISKKINAILTPTQRATYAKLLGKPFKMPSMFSSHGGGHGGR